jgi:magnesium chelatase subunit H
MDNEVDALYRAAFKGITCTLPAPSAAAAAAAAADPAGAVAVPQTLSFPDGLSDAEFGELGRSRPDAVKALLEAKEQADADGWRRFQADVSTLKLRRQRVVGQVAEARGLLDAAARAESKAAGLAVAEAESSVEEETTGRQQQQQPGGLLKQLFGGAKEQAVGSQAPPRPVRIVLICGFESFNVGLYQQAARRLQRRAPHVTLQVFSDRDIGSDRARVAAALAGADAFFGSLLFDYDAVR